MVMPQVYFGKKGLDLVHNKYMDMINWDKLPPAGTSFVTAKSCQVNKGVLGQDRVLIPIPIFIYVDDCLIAEVRSQMERALLTCLEAIFVVMGRPQISVRRFQLAMDQWVEIMVSHEVTLLGLRFNSREMTMGINREYLDEK